MLIGATGKCKWPMKVTRTASASHSRHSWFTPMPFGLKHARRTFKYTMYIISSSVKWHMVLVYLEYIAIFTKSPDKYIDHIWLLLPIFKYAEVALNWNQSKLFTNGIDYLSPFMKPRHLEAGSHEIFAIWGSHPPSKITKLRSYLGLSVFLAVRTEFLRTAAPSVRKCERKNYTSIQNYTMRISTHWIF